MHIIHIKRIIGLVALLSVAGFALAFASNVRAADAINPPDLPPSCENLQVPAGNSVFFRTYALGVQIYRWNGAVWEFVAPVANLYADAGFNGKVGTHYAGPVWESNSGSKVLGSVLSRCTADTAAIPWLLLEASPAEEFGIFRKVTYIQRVSTVGGLPPASAGSVIGEEAMVPYTAEYYFYRAGD